jgi:hypothetical protein
MLTSDEIQTIAKEIMNGLPVSIKGVDADKFAAELKEDLALAKKNGWIIELPHEIPDLSTKE